ncbi:hypothetical protein K438DRAFT_1605879, partial [Mycena galopus ATCC 62051]
ITRLRQIPHRLVAERDALQRYCDESRSVAAPVRRLPPEILAEIFTLCSSTSILYCDGTQIIPATYLVDPVGQPHLMPLLRVCSTWYTIVMGTPSLWANIEVNLEVDGSDSKAVDRKVAHISRSLDQSRHHPLTIHLNT